MGREVWSRTGRERCGQWEEIGVANERMDKGSSGKV